MLIYLFTYLLTSLSHGQLVQCLTHTQCVSTKYMIILLQSFKVSQLRNTGSMVQGASFVHPMQAWRAHCKQFITLPAAATNKVYIKHPSQYPSLCMSQTTFLTITSRPGLEVVVLRYRCIMPTRVRAGAQRAPLHA